MPSLFISLGTSPAIVPEAFLLPDVTFSAVHVLTTERPDVSLVQDFFRHHAPQTRLTITRVANFSDFTSEADHFRFEEVMYRWFLDAGSPPEDRYICLSGGFKTMSATMQKAAAVLGASEVFHVLADNCCTTADGKPCPPATSKQILQAHANGHLRFIRLGPESGWPQFHGARTEDYPLLIEKQEKGVTWVTAPDERFRLHLRAMVERSHHIARAWEKLPQLPFPILATWSPAQLDWLNEPLHPGHDRPWVERLPKVELHCHLGGFATSGRELETVRAAATQPAQLPALAELNLPPQWPLPDAPLSLHAYMRLGNNNGTALLRDPGCLRRQCERLYEHCLAQNILYAEVRCSPANYATPDRSPWQVLCDIRQHFQRCMADQNNACHINLILIATRRQQGGFRAAISRHLALAVTAAEHWTQENECRVVGVDLAGYEDVTTRAHYFREEFTAVHRCGLALTVHAGENDDAEGIWRAVFDLNSRRLGHALHLIDSPELMRSVADRGIGVEMCPYANFQIKGFPLDPPNSSHPSVYPLKRYLNAGIRATVNTDNIGISGASLTDNLLLAVRLCPGLSRLDVLHLLANALAAAFVSPAQRERLQRACESQLPLP